MGWSEKRTDIQGKEYTQHFNDDGSKAGWSEQKTDIQGNEYTQHRDEDDSKAGWSEQKTDIQGKEYTQHRNEDGSSMDNPAAAVGSVRPSKIENSASSLGASIADQIGQHTQDNSNFSDAAPAGGGASSGWGTVAKVIGLLVLVAIFYTGVRQVYHSGEGGQANVQAVVNAPPTQSQVTVSPPQASPQNQPNSNVALEPVVPAQVASPLQVKPLSPWPGCDVQASAGNKTSLAAYRATMGGGDYRSAVRLAAEAANQNCPSAQVALGKMYFHGFGAQRNYSEALALFHKASEQDDAIGQCKSSLILDAHGN